MASLQASYALIEGVGWVQICACPFHSTLESTAATFGRQYKQQIAG